jgi:hypothetical protein
MVMEDLAFALMPKRLASNCRLRRDSVLRLSLLAVRVAAAVVVVCGMSVLALSVSLALPRWLILE